MGNDRLMEQRSSVRRTSDTPVSIVLAGTSMRGVIDNISFDGMLVKVESGGPCPTECLGEKAEIEALDGRLVHNLRRAGKLIRLFDVEGTQHLALRFLDYLD
ncbi:MAG: PilZ domain-containing protein [Treponema sp.]|nr:PilZ domain-containing protein [Treponema sp.]